MEPEALVDELRVQTCIMGEEKEDNIILIAFYMRYQTPGQEGLQQKRNAGVAYAINHVLKDGQKIMKMEMAGTKIEPFFYALQQFYEF